MATGHQVRESALPIGRAAAMVPPPASRAASRHASARRAGRQARSAPHFLLLSVVRVAVAVAAVGLAAAGAGNGQVSPVTVDRRRASRVVAAAVRAVAMT